VTSEATAPAIATGQRHNQGPPPPAADVRALLRRDGGAGRELPRQRGDPHGLRSRGGEIQELYLDGHKQAAAAAVPTELLEQLTLIGSKDKIRDELEAWRESIVTTLLVGGDPATVRTAAELLLG
jgi:alkanesulfonate monooxygenase SsuD/methylene tetrahydromethanopterin reductase-like flavin-dependent oxidoreductase (luciferase family)